MILPPAEPADFKCPSTSMPAILEHIQVTESEKKRGTGCDNPACVTGKIVLFCAPTGIPFAFRFHVAFTYLASIALISPYPCHPCRSEFCWCQSSDRSLGLEKFINASPQIQVAGKATHDAEAPSCSKSNNTYILLPDPSPGRESGVDLIPALDGEIFTSSSLRRFAIDTSFRQKQAFALRPDTLDASAI
ncbi:hypothetical protein SAMN05216412_10383 [Nitrosospira multiformis]|uniref:Uncharacterized protein n=1 Tax=Nitrosospira multiformis TaxID=1231 RepID=A0A1I0BNW6_9PROT|nr:hypothetical protein SAMN05216412_10383 [Nitrosospira multiformis]